MKTIEERLDKMLRARDATAPAGYEHAKRAITDPWTTAVKAMEFLVNEYYDETTPCAENDHPGWWGCQYCGGEKYSNPELHMPDHCPVAAQQAALAAMKGETDEGS